MLWKGLLFAIAIGYLAILFAVAYFGDKRADEGRSVIANPYIYTLSIAVYCTAWTFYGSVGRAATTGVSFLSVYLGPTLIAVLWWFVLRKMVRISKAQRITTIPDFIASRYGKSGFLAGLVTVIAVVGIMPYVALQLKAMSISFLILGAYPGSESIGRVAEKGIWGGTEAVLAVLLAVFAILFGTRHIDATERHEGMVLAVAFESFVKLLAFLSVGIFVTFGLFNGFGDLFEQALKAGHGELLKFQEDVDTYSSWFTITFLSMMAILFLPRQFQLLVVENVNEDHIRTASWLFPLYLLVINLFVLPIAFAGLLTFPDADAGQVADRFVLLLPISEQVRALAVLVFIGGLSAATSMVIVASIALSTMICNDLVMPVLLRIKAFHLDERGDLTVLLKAIRRGGIVLVVLLGYVYERLIGESYALVTIGLVSFAAAAQFAPPIIIGIYWKRATRAGAIVGLTGGFAVWCYTLLLPNFAISDLWIGEEFVLHGPFGIELLRPRELFGLSGMDPLTHAVFWSMLVNIGGMLMVSLFTQRSAIERVQAELFVEIYDRAVRGGTTSIWRGETTVSELFDLVARFIGRKEATRAFDLYATQVGLPSQEELRPDPGLIQHAERLLAGAIGNASARVVVSSVVRGEVLSIDEVMTILDETSQILDHSHRIEQKSRELQRATNELKAANERLQELDRLKDEFVSTVTHELRTPLTSIRAFSEILLKSPELELEKRQEFLGIIVKESERLTRLINQVLDFAKLESGRVDWQMEQLDLNSVIRDAINATSQLFKDKSARLETELAPGLATTYGDYDRLMQVLINLLSNAVKFCAPDGGQVHVSLESANGCVRVRVRDNGHGIPPEQHERIFQRFHQVSDKTSGKPKGTGLGLAISRHIIEHHNGSIWVESAPGEGATFCVELPMCPRVEEPVSEAAS